MWSNKLKMRCTIIDHGNVWFRFSSTQQSVDKFDQIKLFIRNHSFGKYHRQLTVRIPLLEFYVSVNPFEPQIVISAGRRFFTYFWFQLKYEKSTQSI